MITRPLDKDSHVARRTLEMGVEPQEGGDVRLVMLTDDMFDWQPGDIVENPWHGWPRLGGKTNPLAEARHLRVTAQHEQVTTTWNGDDECRTFGWPVTIVRPVAESVCSELADELRATREFSRSAPGGW